MGWARFDDQFPEHPKIDALTDGAFRLHVSAICYANRHLTDGFIPAAKATRLTPRHKASHVAELVDAGLWHKRQDGYDIHDYLDYQPSAEKVLAEREAAAERMRRIRTPKRRSPERSGEQTANNRRTFGGSSASPSHPIPSPPPQLPTHEGNPPPLDDDGRIEEACRHLAQHDLAQRRAQRSDEPIRDTDAWLNAAAQRRHHSDAEQLHNLAQAHPDWTGQQLAEAVSGNPPADPVASAQALGRNWAGLFNDPDEALAAFTAELGPDLAAHALNAWKEHQ